MSCWHFGHAYCGKFLYSEVMSMASQLLMTGALNCPLGLHPRPNYPTYTCAAEVK